MKPMHYESAGINWIVTALAACCVGLVLCPFAYVAIGALAGFAPAFSFLTIPPLLLATGYLLWRFFAQRATSLASGWLVAAEWLSMLLIGAFLTIVSGFTLLSAFERVGLFAMLFSVTTMLALPIVLKRTTPLGERLARWPKAITLPLLVAIFLATLVAVTGYLLAEPVFL